jgi:hypothetical protein
MTAWLVGIWLLFVAVVALNGVAGTAAAMQHALRSKQSRGGRTFLASAIAGFLAASSIVAIAILGTAEGEPQAPMVLVAVFGMCFAVATLVSVPGAIVVANKLEAPGDDFRAFE